MDYAHIPLFQLMQEKMRFHSARQSVLASNVANADTPGWQAHDLKTPDFKAMLAGASSAMQMSVTNPMHMHGGGGMGKGLYKTIERKSDYEINPDDNRVNVEEEIVKVSQNQSEYQVAVNLYRKTTDMFRTALGRSGGA